VIPRVAMVVVTLAALQQAAPFRVETRLVVLQATVKNQRGELVTGLPRDAFTVLENGKRQPIALFGSDDVPVSLGLLIDNSGSMRTKRVKVEAAALDFARASNPQDEIFVLNFADKSRIDVPMTGDLRALETGIARVDSIGGTAMRDAIAAGEDYLTRNAHRDRKVLIVITDGNDNASVTELDRIRATADQHDIVVYAVGLLADRDPHAGRLRHDLVQLAEASGGLAYFPMSVEEIGDLALEMARQIRMQYTIGYTPLNQSLDGSYRTIRVMVKGSEPLTVRTRTGYRASPTAPEATG
jgi:Ca-activated chloride channel family protein